MKTKLLLISLIMSLRLMFAQDVSEPDQLSRITYDYNKNELKGEMPFDHFFKIVYKGIPVKSIQTVFFYEVEYKNDKFLGSKVRDVKYKELKISKDTIVQKGTHSQFLQSIQLKIETIKNKKGKIKTENFDTDNVTGESIFIVGYIKENAPIVVKHKKLKVNDAKGLTNSSQSIVDPVDPVSMYEIAILKNNSNSNILIYNEFFGFLQNNSDKLRQISFFKTKILPLRQIEEKRTYPIAPFPINYDSFLERIKPITDHYNAGFTIQNISNLDPTIDNNLISTIANQLKSNKFKVDKFNEIMPMFLTMDADEIKSLVYGLDKGIKNYDFEKRLKNLKSSIEDFKGIKKELSALQLFINDNNINIFINNFLDPILNNLNSNFANLKEYNSTLVSLINKNLPELVLISTSTLGDDLKASNSSSLIPDVGIINAVNINSNGDIKYIGRPYIGLNWHFAGINRSQYLREIPNKKFRHCFSIAFGITIGKIDNEYYEDFYNNISPALGVNYRLSRQIRAGIGTLFVREKNQNPIVDDSNIVLAPYLSLTFDLGLLQEATKLLGKIGI